MPVRGRGRWPATTLVDEHHPDGVIQTYVALRKPQSERAITLLKEVGQNVKGLMQKHGWRLPILAEMYPRSIRLLGLNYNQGQKICLRLRHSDNPLEFLSRDEIIGTMLHELAHNVRGSHDEAFYKTLRDLTEEYEEAQRLGYWPGLGFSSPGIRLGGMARPNYMYTQRELAAASAEARRAGSTPTRLGGSVPPSKLLRELAAEAAMQRILDAQTCASASQHDVEEVLAETQQAEAQHNVIVVLDSDDEDTYTPPMANATGSRDDPIEIE